MCMYLQKTSAGILESCWGMLYNAKLFLFLEAVENGEVLDYMRNVILNTMLRSSPFLKKESER